VLNLSFSKRISGYFGALFLIAVGLLFLLWFLGLPVLGLPGARSQLLAETERILEIQADLQRALIANALKARRGDILILSENKSLAEDLTRAQARTRRTTSTQDRAQRTTVRLFERLQRAYPDRYQQLMVIDPANYQIHANSKRDDPVKIFADTALIDRAAQVGAAELIEQVSGFNGRPALAILRQIYTVDGDGYAKGDLLGILMVVIDLQYLVGDGFQNDLPLSGKHGVTRLFDASGQALVGFVNESAGKFTPRPRQQMVEGFEGTLLETDTLGREMVVVYRHLQLSGTQGWVLVHYASKEETLGDLQDHASTLVIAGIGLTLLALALIQLVARRLTQPLTKLAEAAHTLGTGNLAVRVQIDQNESPEIKQLSEAFNTMAFSIEEERHTLEAKVQERTTDLRIAATAFESQEGMFVTDANWVILRVNHAFMGITGYAAEEAVGQRPQSLLGSMQHSGDFYATMQATVVRDGKWQSELWIKRKNGEDFQAWVIITAVKTVEGITTHYVSTQTDITLRKAAEDEIKNLAFFDPLTHLPNRRLLMERLGQALAGGARHQRKGALLFVDLDDFKTLNDTLGHDKGDLLLQQVAQRLSTCTREGDTVARLGGDEFVVLLENLSEDAMEAATQAEVVGEKILSCLNQTYQLSNVTHHSTPSMGITLFGERHETIDEPLKRADLAMYQAKAAGRNTLRFFDPQMQSVVTARAALELSLREAVTQGQFVLYYQAQLMGERKVTGAEVLVRWCHPQHGMVSPAEFIPLAESSGLILPIGQWVLETACAQLVQWATQPDMAHLTIAVNVSPRQFHQVDFVEQVQAVLDKTGARPQCLKLELTEGLLVSNIKDIIVKMKALKCIGVGFSLDDFGTGYSSLTYLKQLPLDQLKIDQSFVKDILTNANDAAIAQMVIVLAESLGLVVIAEGVETEEQRLFLVNQGCHAYQGYLFSRPVPVGDFEALVTYAVANTAPQGC
jgi:diguanylate cyclase (GGDEF)-like protein/PAS domain S-box-containing protein